MEVGRLRADGYTALSAVKGNACAAGGVRPSAASGSLARLQSQSEGLQVTAVGTYHDIVVARFDNESGR